MAYIVFSPEFLPYISTAVNIIISFTPLLSYGSTVLSIRRKQSSQGFSIDICGTMLVASTLRIFYYFNDPFEITLLRQCFVMVFIQTILLKVALKYRSEDSVHFEVYHSNWEALYEKSVKANNDIIEDTFDRYELNDNYSDYDLLTITRGILIIFWKCIYVNILMLFSCLAQGMKDVLRLFDYHYVRPFHYWQWREPYTFWKFLFGFLAFLSVVQLAFNGNPYLGIVFGSISFMIESSLPLPQILLFQRFKNSENFKIILLLSWLGGDFTKISYLFYGTENVGFIFIFAAFFQMSLNFVITYQFFYYKMYPSNTPTEIQLSHLPTHSNRSPVGTSAFKFNSRSPTINNTFADEKNEFTKSFNKYKDMNMPKTSVSRAASISLNKMITNSSSSNIIPQSQHHLDSKTLSLATEGGYNEGGDYDKGHYKNHYKDGVDIAANVDISAILPKLNENFKGDHGCSKANDENEVNIGNHSTSFDSSNILAVGKENHKVSLDNGMVEEMRSRAGTFLSSADTGDHKIDGL